MDQVDLGTMGSSKDRQLSRLRRLSAAEVEDLIGRHHEGATVNVLATEFGIHRKTVMDHLRRAGIPRRSDAMRWTPEQLAHATDLYRQGLSAAAIGGQFGLDPSTVSRRLKRAGVVLRPRRGSN
jgi:DNA-directed RNA polymerase specialized sigma24 family protein